MDTSSPEFLDRAKKRANWSITSYHDLDAMKAAEYAYWATQPAHVVMTTVAAMTAEAYAMKGIHVSRLQRPHRAP